MKFQKVERKPTFEHLHILMKTFLQGQLINSLEDLAAAGNDGHKEIDPIALFTQPQSTGLGLQTQSNASSVHREGCNISYEAMLSK